MKWVIYWHGIELREFEDEQKAVDSFKWFNTFLCPRFLTLKTVSGTVHQFYTGDLKNELRWRT